MVGMLAALVLLALPSQGPPPEPKIVSRTAWGAQAPVLPMKAHKIGLITIHHTGTAQKPDVALETKLRNLQSWCQKEGKLASGKVKPAWPDVPYHYYISTDGRVGEGREAGYVGDTNTS